MLLSLFVKFCGIFKYGCICKGIQGLEFGVLGQADLLTILTPSSVEAMH